MVKRVTVMGEVFKRQDSIASLMLEVTKHTLTMPNPDPDQPLHYREYNTHSPHATLLIHGAATTASELIPVAESLPNYQILVPNLHLYSADPAGLSRLLTVPLAIDIIAALVRSHAQDGKAHVVGTSMGAHVALHFAADHAELMDCLFVTAVLSVKTTLLRSLMPYGKA